MAWLKRMNTRGYDVLIQLDGNHGLLLLKGGSKANLETLKKRGFIPVAEMDTGAVATKRGEAIREAVGGGAQRAVGGGLRKRIGLSVGLMAGPMDARLAGFTNR